MAFNVTPKHVSTAKKAFENKARSLEVRETLMKNGLTQCQANSCIRTARKQMKIFKPNGKGGNTRAMQEANKQAEMKTKVDLDA